jgi:HSP20 family protein
MSFFNSLTRSQNGSCAAVQADSAVRPTYEIAETDASYNLTVNLPGVSKEGLEITDEGGALTIVGKRATKLAEGLEFLHRESSDSAFELVLTHDNTVDSEKIEAELKDGVLQLKLNKAESAKPRKIAVS